MTSPRHPHRPDIAGLWRTYGQHASVMLSAGPAPRLAETTGSFVALSGAPYVDLNQVALFGEADRMTARSVVETVLDADVPCLVGVSATVRDDVSGELLGGGFEAIPERDAMFYSPAIPMGAPHAFRVRRVSSVDDHAAVRLILAEAHGYADPMEAQTHGPALLGRSDVGCWVAWDGPDPVSCVFVTRVDRTLGVFDMMTPPRHRRRGAARAVLTEALADASGWGDPADTIAFWATPAGRPLYESMGFTIVDDIDVWTLGATPEELAAVGAG
jgi:GNAT superfamily N-acetyltransferase